MAKGRERFEKRQLQKAKQEKQAAKRERRHAKKDRESGPGVDEEALMERFRQVSEQKEAGAIDDATFELERHKVFVALGLEEPDPDILGEEFDDDEDDDE